MAWFSVRKTASGIKFDLKKSDGQVVATSEVYESEAACINGIKSVKKNCTGQVEDCTLDITEVIKNPKYEIFRDKAGEFRFRLKARNGKVIAVSDRYRTKSAVQNCIDVIKHDAPCAEIIKEQI